MQVVRDAFGSTDEAHKLSEKVLSLLTNADM